MSRDDRLPSKSDAKDTEVEAFLKKVRSIQPAQPGAGGRGRLIFALDATASRQPAWDRAMHIQADMFRETQVLGGLDIQLVFYRGYGECKASKWYSAADALLRVMTGVTCLAGRTQIRKVLKHGLAETKKRKVNALVFVGDAMEEDVDELGHLAGELGLLGLPCFLFHEGGDPLVRNVFEQIARLSGGACCAFDASAAQQLRDLLSAVAVYAAGGHKALADFSAKRGGVTRLLTSQVR
ncbi:VWA domain-containing protein [Algihabitans albus]|uniref:VWA domain-containing protein n=1 Tax=Algihabitans albus TaxID=2164067 RepID=UPI000E5CE9BC|nr:VWA domain-containing protein [Algihabitans albus]